MLNLFKKLFGDKHEKDIAPLRPIVVEINKYFEECKNLSDEQLKQKTDSFKEIIQNGTAEIRGKIDELNTELQSNEEFDRQAIHDQLEELETELQAKFEEILDELLPEAFAVVKDTCRRLVGTSWTVMGHKQNWDMVPYDTQLMGGVVLHQGKIAEMATGEGKTLVATLPMYLNALTGRGVHLVTVNDYLAQRDSEWMGEIFKFHGLTVGVILNTMSPDQRKVQYACDITYGTNNEFGFDYLRDNMAVDKDHQVQRPHNYAIVDEVDSVLIDEARTPLIISGAVDVDDQKFDEMKPNIERLHRLQTNFVAKIIQEAEELLTNSTDKNASFEAGKSLLRAYRGLPKSKKLACIFRTIK
jgi:preprotein translocase subunit SecA